MANTEDKLTDAKKALESANNFTKSVNSQAHYTPSHENVNAPYKIATQARKSGTSLPQEAKSAGEGIKARMENEGAALKSIQQ